MEIINWKELNRIETIGKIPGMGDNFYDGIIEAHNEDYFITQEGTQCEHCEDIGEHCSECGYAEEERIYLVYSMDYIFKYLLEGPIFQRLPEDLYIYPRCDGYVGADLSASDYNSFNLDLLMAARDHTKSLKPLRYIFERDLERFN